jgi:hypothetical protein
MLGSAHRSKALRAATVREWGGLRFGRSLAHARGSVGRRLRSPPGAPAPLDGGRVAFVAGRGDDGDGSLPSLAMIVPSYPQLPARHLECRKRVGHFS